MTNQQDRHRSETAAVRDKRAEIMRLAQKMTPDQRKLLIAALERMAKSYNNNLTE